MSLCTQKDVCERRWPGLAPMTPCSSAFQALNETVVQEGGQSKICAAASYTLLLDIEICGNVVGGLLVVLLGPQTMGCRTDCDKSESVLFAQSCLTLLRSVYGL